MTRSDHAEHVPEPETPPHVKESSSHRVFWMVMGSLISSIIALTVFTSAEWIQTWRHPDHEDRRSGFWVESNYASEMYIGPHFATIILFLRDEGYEGQEIEVHGDGQISAKLICANTGTIAGRLEIEPGNFPKATVFLNEAAVTLPVLVFHRAN